MQIKSRAIFFKSIGFFLIDCIALPKLFIKEQKFGENVKPIIIVSETGPSNHSILTRDGGEEFILEIFIKSGRVLLPVSLFLMTNVL